MIITVYAGFLSHLTFLHKFIGKRSILLPFVRAFLLILFFSISGVLELPVFCSEKFRTSDCIDENKER